jgi:DNA-binding IclR family transcriptional regulator
MDGMIAVGVPVTDPNGRLVSTLSFHAPVQRLAMEDAKLHVEVLRRAATHLSALISE